MARGGPSRLSDYAVNALAFVLAGSCSFFAGYMILRLQGMENPPADMGLNFPPPRKRVITDDSILVDPLATGTIKGDANIAPRPGRPLQPYTKNSPVLDQRLLTVIDDVAFIEVIRVTGKEILPAAVGDNLPGIGTIESIRRLGGQWEVVAGDQRLVR